MLSRETDNLRDQRIEGTENGLTLRTRIVQDKTKYTRKLKHKGKTDES